VDAMSALSGKAENICSQRVFPVLTTQCGHSDGMGRMRWQSHPILTLCAPAATSCR
jgi:hypothetical protein